MEYEVKQTEITVLIEAGELPDGAVVTKRNGTAQYVIRREVTINGLKDKPNKLEAGEDTVFLWPVNAASPINAISAKTVLAWTTTMGGLHRLLESKIVHK